MKRHKASNGMLPMLLLAIIIALTILIIATWAKRNGWISEFARP